MASPGRESKFTEERRASILADIAAGNSQACAAERAGITDRTLRNWLGKGKRADAPADFASFFSAYKKAERDCEKRNIEALQAIGHGGQLVERRTVTRTRRDGTVEEEVTEKFSLPQWTALAWWAERKYPEDWGKDAEILREMIAEHVKKRKGRARG